MTAITEQYEEWMRSWGAADSTISARMTLARRCLDTWGLEGFTKENAQTLLAGRDIKSAWSRVTYYNHLMSLCQWMVAAGYLSANPMDEVRKPRKGSSLPRPLSEDEVERVLSVVQGDVRTWILLGLHAGLRVSEIAAIQGQDVTARGIYVEGKGGKREMLPCSEEVWEAAQAYPRRGPWFAGPDEGHIRAQRISLTVGRLFASLGIDGSIHRCRHTFGTNLLRAGVHIRKVQKLMRHASLQTTANYTAVDEDELRDAVALLPSYRRPGAA